jgi:hypothetical protein
MTDTLEQVIGDAREQAAVLRYHGHAIQAASLEKLCEEVTRVMRPFLAVLSEKEAMLRAGKGVDYFRGQFPGWESRGLAMLDDRGRRTYREIVVPVRAQDDAARLRGERGESLHAS